MHCGRACWANSNPFTYVPLNCVTPQSGAMHIFLPTSNAYIPIVYFTNILNPLLSGIFQPV